MDVPSGAPSWATTPSKRTRQAAGKESAAVAEAQLEGSTSATNTGLGEGSVPAEQIATNPARDRGGHPNHPGALHEGRAAHPLETGQEDVSAQLGSMLPQGVLQGDPSSFRVLPSTPTAPMPVALLPQPPPQLHPQHQIPQQEALSAVQAAREWHAGPCGAGSHAVPVAGTALAPLADGGTARPRSESHSHEDRLDLNDAGKGFAAAVESFSLGVSSLQQQLLGLVAEAAREREALAAERSALEAERLAFEHERTRVAQVINDGQQVLLSVGGKRYTTSITTLRNAPEPSLFSAMFSGRHALRPSESDGSIFIDRDGTHFATILNFLRDGTLAYPPDGNDYKYLLQLRSEAQFYGLAGLTAAIDRYPWGLVRASRCAQLNTTDSWLYEDGPDEVVFCVDAPCQLLGLGLSGTESGYSADIEVVHVADDFSVQLKVLATLSQSFVQADGPIVRAMLPTPVTLVPGHNYMLHAFIKGTDSFYVEEALELVVVGGVRLQFMPWESPNGTNEQRGTSLVAQLEDARLGHVEVHVRRST